MGFLGLPIPSIRVFGDNSSPVAEEPEIPGTPPKDGTSSPNASSTAGINSAPRSTDSLRVSTTLNSFVSQESTPDTLTRPISDKDHERVAKHSTSGSRSISGNALLDEERRADPMSEMILRRAGSESQTKVPQSPVVASMPQSPILNDDSFTSNRTQQTSYFQYQHQQQQQPQSPQQHTTSQLSRSGSVNASKLLGGSKEVNPPDRKPSTAQQKSSGGGGGFFSKVFKSSGRPTQDDENDTSMGDKREEGWKADVFGYVPNFPTPPKYIHVRAHRKQKRELNRVFLAQELNPHPEQEKDKSHSRGRRRNSHDSRSTKPSDAPLPADVADSDQKAIWCCKFSQDGKYLATAGEDRVVRVWQVLSSPKDRDDFESEHDDGSQLDTTSDDDDRASRYSKRRGTVSSRNGPTGGGTGRKRVYAPVFRPRPIREYYGHSSDVLDLSWSKNNFLLSSSMDKTVRLWHVDRTDCLCTFLHSDFVTSIRFHPTDDRFFLSGSLDCKLRLWSIPDKEVAYFKDVPDLITAVSFTPDGLTAIAGCFGGQCLFYETDGLHFQTQMHVRSARGRNSKGSKITGIEAFLLPSKLRYQGSFDSEIKLLVSTNDSRVRLYNLHDKSMEVKFKGHENEQSQIAASFSDNGEYIISGSEDDRTYIWRTQARQKDTHKKKDIQEYEYFHSNRSAVTVAIFAPTSTRKLLALSEDPVYDLCDPPPVRLVPKDDSITLEQSSARRSNDTSQSESSSSHKNSRRNSHYDGNIIITADSDGFIKIFRQDCAYEPRKMFAENASIMQKKRMSTLSPAHSWRESMSLNRSRSVRDQSPSAARSWLHHGVATHQPQLQSSSASSAFYSNNGASYSYRNVAPYGNGNNNNNNSNGAPFNGKSSSSGNGATATSLTAPHHSPGSSPGGSRRSSIGEGVVHPIRSPAQSSIFSHSQYDPKKKSPLGMLDTVSSKLQSHSDNLLSPTTPDSEADDEEDELRCLNCGSTSFRAKRVDGKTRLVCSSCKSVAPS